MADFQSFYAFLQSLEGLLIEELDSSMMRCLRRTDREVCPAITKKFDLVAICFIVEDSDPTNNSRHVSGIETNPQLGADSVTEIEREVEEETSGLMEDRISSIIFGPVSKPTLEINATYPGAGVAETGGVVVRAEEALIVILVLVLWVAAIALFFNRWGKIRMLEPYQPKFQQQHRQSCAMIDANPLPHRTCSKFNIHCLEHPVVYPAGYGSSISRPRQNSVFVGSSVSLLPPQNTPRRAKSAFDLQTLIVAECGLTNSHVNGLDLDRSRRGRDFSKATTDPARLGTVELQSFARTPTPMQRQRGMSICHFDRTDVLARPLIRERGMSICQFDRGENAGKHSPRERGTSICQSDRQMPSCSKTPDVVHSYRATCV